MKIGICHYRIGRTDGVSLEIEKRKEILRKLGHEVCLISGPVSSGSDYIINELEFDNPEIKELKENIFSYFQVKTLKLSEIREKMKNVSVDIQKQLEIIHKKEQFKALLVHNIFSHGRHIAAAHPFYKFVIKYNLPILSTNHDYYWERPEYQKLRFCELRRFLKHYVPPSKRSIKHISINSIAAEILKNKRNIASTVLPDIFDFSQPEWQIDEFNRDLPETVGFTSDDLIILQATRIAPRKGIELAVQYVKGLQKIKQELIGKTLYNGKKFNDQSQIVLILAGYAEKNSLPYLNQLRQEIKKSGITAFFISDIIQAQRQYKPQKYYSLWDVYAFADLVTYPSLQEGWGNQFIEAVFARKPIVLFEYPVFKKDIKKEGYSYISLGDKISKSNKNGLVKIDNDILIKTVEDSKKILFSKSTIDLLKNNFKIGKKFHGYSAMEKYLKKWSVLCFQERQ